jgi:hypothetical protein
VIIVGSQKCTAPARRSCIVCAAAVWLLANHGGFDGSEPFALFCDTFVVQPALDGDEDPMAWKDKSSATFTGASGQMAVIGELLQRGCNAAIPQVDVGTDVFAFRDDGEDVARIQVKTARAKWRKKGRGYSATFGVPMAKLFCQPAR